MESNFAPSPLLEVLQLTVPRYRAACESSPPLGDGEAAELQLQRWHDGMVRCPVINFVVTITLNRYTSATCVLQCY